MNAKQRRKLVRQHKEVVIVAKVAHRMEGFPQTMVRFSPYHTALYHSRGPIEAVVM
jgi:hypothetical protein